MKKLLALFVFCLILLPGKAQTSDWNKMVQEFVKGFDDEAKTIEEQFTSLGINAQVSTAYNSSKKQLELKINLPEVMWNIFDNTAVTASKEAMVQEYRKAYKDDADFAAFINVMKENNSSFQISYTTDSNGKLLSKSFTISPNEIIN